MSPKYPLGSFLQRSLHCSHFCKKLGLFIICKMEVLRGRYGNDFIGTSLIPCLVFCFVKSIAPHGVRLLAWGGLGKLHDNMFWILCFRVQADHLLLNHRGESFVEYDVCPTCDSIYEFKDCFRGCSYKNKT